MTLTDNLPTKGDDRILGDNIALAILNSDNPVQTYVKFAYIKKALDKAWKDKEVREKVKQELKDEDKGYSVNGITIQSRVSRYNYDFSVCGHPLYDKLVDIINELEVYKKLIEDDLKKLLKEAQRTDVKARIKSNTIVIEQMPKIVWTDYGEIVEVSPPNVKPTESIYVK